MIPIPPKLLPVIGKVLAMAVLMLGSWYAGGKVKEAEVIAAYNAEAAVIAQEAIDADLANRKELAKQAREFNLAITQEKVNYEKAINEIQRQPVLRPVTPGSGHDCPIGYSDHVVRVLDKTRANPSLSEADDRRGLHGGEKTTKRDPPG